MTNPQSYEERLATAFGCHQSGRIEEAEAIYRGLLDEPVAHFDVLHLLGLICYQDGRLEEADDLIARALVIDPESSEAASNHGLVLLRLNRGDEAVLRFEQAIRNDPQSRSASGNYTLGLIATRRYADALEHNEREIELDPKSIEALFGRAQALYGLERYDDARYGFIRVLDMEPRRISALLAMAACCAAQQRTEEASTYAVRVLEIDPENAEALVLRADTLAGEKQLDQALELAERASLANPRSASMHLRRSQLLGRLERYGEAIAACDAALEIEPRNVEALFFRGVGEQSQFRYDNALACYQAAIAIDAGHASSHWNEAYCQLTLGQLGIGFRNYEWRWKDTSLGKKPRGFSAPLWLGDAALADKTILLHSEQGFGDTFQFLRYVAPVTKMAARVLLEVPKAVVPLVAPLFGEDNVFATGVTLPEFDFQCPLPSLALALGTTEHNVPANMPYLHADATHLAKWQARLGEQRGVRIGVAWSGNQQHVNDAGRSIALKEFLGAFPDGVELIGLQKEVRHEDQAALQTMGAPNMHTEAILDFADTAAIIELVDLVICIDTGIAHLAGALNRETWILLDTVSDWRWQLIRTDSPWYPSVRLYRQIRARQWTPILKQIRRDLKDRRDPRKRLFGWLRKTPAAW